MKDFNNPIPDPLIDVMRICVGNTIFHLKMALFERGENGYLLGQDMIFIKSNNLLHYVHILGAGVHLISDKCIGNGIGKAQYI